MLSLKTLNLFAYIILLLSGPAVFGQHPDRTFLRISTNKQNIKLETSDGWYKFTPYTPQIIETTFVPDGQVPVPTSHAVVLEPQQVEFEVSEDAEKVVIDTDGLDVVVQKSPFQVSYYYAGEQIISEKKGYISKGDEDYEKIEFNLEEPEILFGGGARALGMNRRGHRLKLYNKADYGYGTRSDLLNYSLPVVLSSKKYMLHFDNAPVGYLDLDSKYNNTLTYETIGGRKTYQLIVGETWQDLVSNYTQLTGRQPMPPRWALGNFSSRFGYHSSREVLQTIRKFKEDDIPVDAVVLDLFWFGKDIKGNMGNLAFDRDSFPEPEEMIEELAQQGVHSILITEPFVQTTSNRWEEAVAQEVLATDSLGNPYTFDFYFGNTGLIDIFKPAARDWFWRIYKDLVEMGISGWWGDLGEPEMHPPDLQHVLGSANEVHNIYGHYWAKLIYKGYQQDFPQQRPFILMRAGAAGSQRYGLIPWSGDVSRTWQGLEPQPEISLQMGLQGLAYMHSDLGGFAGDNLDNELYARWLQYGVFQPIFRPHAQEAVASEPVFKEPYTKALAKKAIKLRYRLLPYNYTLAFRNSIEGIPLMRPLFFEEPGNYRLYSISNEYLWGPDFLVSPVVRPEIESKEIYFPKTSNWFDFYTGEKYAAGTRATVKLHESYIPTFVRGGALVPMSEPVANTAAFSAEDVVLHYFYDSQAAKSTGTYYHDDGLTADSYEKGIFEILNFRGRVNGKNIKIVIERAKGRGLQEIQFERMGLVVHNLHKRPRVVKVNGRKTTAAYLKAKNELRLQVPLEQKENIISIIN